MNDLTVFTAKGCKLRAVFDEKNRAWFVATDLAKLLSVSGTAALTDGLPEEALRKAKIDTREASRPRLLIDETGVRSCLAQATPGTLAVEWMKDQVLPNIRQIAAFSFLANELGKDQERATAKKVPVAKLARTNNKRIREVVAILRQANLLDISGHPTRLGKLFSAEDISDDPGGGSELTWHPDILKVVRLNA